MSEKETLPMSAPFDTSKLGRMLHNPDLIKLTYPHEHVKKWGIEYWIHNDEESGYCMKHIVCYHDIWSSEGMFHYHNKKDEVFLVVDGTLRLDVEIDGVINQLTLLPFTYFRVKPGVKHRFKAGSMVCHFIEASTVHSDDDSFRCYYSHDRKQWVDGTKYA